MCNVFLPGVGMGLLAALVLTGCEADPPASATQQPTAIAPAAEGTPEFVPAPPPPSVAKPITPAEAFEKWATQSQAAAVGRLPDLIAILKPVTEDVVSEKASPELVQNLVIKYSPVLKATDADYIWCKKNWTLKGKNYSSNIAPEQVALFLYQPENGVPLCDPCNVPQLKTVTGNASLIPFYDRGTKKVVEIICLEIAPLPPSQVEGGPKATPVPPTRYVLWFTCPNLPADAQMHLDAMLKK